MSVDPTYTPVHTSDSDDPFVRTMEGVVSHTDEYFRAPFITELLPGVYLGGVESGLVLPAEIRNIVSLYPWESYTAHHEPDSVFMVSMYDSEYQDLTKIEAIASWVATLITHRQSVLVHCQAGLNRSSLVMARALVKAGVMDSGSDAVDFIRLKRSPQCFSNRSFEKYVREYDGR